jgi:hypothetical protein
MSGFDAVRDAIEGAFEPSFDDVPGPAAANDGDDDRFARAPKAMPEDCPVIPVGTEDGVFFFLTALGELRGLQCDKIANKHIVGMFAPFSDYLRDTWPRRRKVAVLDPASVEPLLDNDGIKITEWVTIGWDNELVPALLMDVCAQKGVWNAREKVRGRGAWKADDGSLVLHCGGKVMMHGRWIAPGMHEDMVYPTAPPVPKPGPVDDREKSGPDLAPLLTGELRSRGIAIADDTTPAELLLELLKTWNWRRKLVDPILCLGWLACAPFGGALDYRPIIWVTGGKAAGKTDFQKLVDWLFEGGIIQSPNASEAGVRQTLGQQSLPVGVDEAEADVDNRKIMQLVTLARLAATSQGNILRGGQDHKATEFRATSCFLFGSILVPPLTAADRSRMALLELDRLPHGSRSPVRDAYKREIHVLGGWLRRRFAERWSDWADTFDAWSSAIVEFGEQGNRAADQFGSLRAAAHVVLGDGEPDIEDLSHWGSHLGREMMAETAGEVDEGEQAIAHLMTSAVQLTGHGAPRLVAEWVAQAAAPVDPDPMREMELDVDRKKANDALGKVGLRVVRGAKGLVPMREYLAVAGRGHRALDRLFEGSNFNEGVWTQALARLPGAVRDINIRIAHVQGKRTCVPIEAAISRDLGETVDAREAVEA